MTWPQVLFSAVSAVILFLFSLQSFSHELQTTGGEALRTWLGRVTSSRWKGLLAGAGATALVHSSSAVTALAVTLVDAGVISFKASLTIGKYLLVACVLAMSGSILASAQLAADVTSQQASIGFSSSLPDAPAPRTADEDPITLRRIPGHILKDQAAIWTSPLRIRTKELIWLVPLGAAVGAGIATDHHVMASVVSHDPDFNQANVDLSNVLVGGILVVPAALYSYGHFQQDAHARTAGLLGAEAIGDGVIVEQGMKLIFWRERPYVDGAHGLFFQGSAGIGSSFPSSHSLLAWSAAAVIAGEYPSPWTQIGVYSMATCISLTRVLGQQHFPTDVLVGSATGWLIGHYVHRSHHDRRRPPP
jgi:hypothetical protein